MFLPYAPAGTALPPLSPPFMPFSAAGGPFTLFTGMQGPSAGTPYSGPYTAGTMFTVTSGGQWLYGYWWWVASSGQDAAPAGGFKFALWQLSSGSAGVLVPNSTATAASLSPGWNYVPLAAPLLLTPCGLNSYGAIYLAAVGYTAALGFPQTTHQFGAGNPHAAGIANGPLFAPSSSGGTAPAGGLFSWTKPQCPFNTSSADPAAVMPASSGTDDILWLDVQVSPVAPASPTWRGMPNSPAFVVPGSGNQALAYTIGVEFYVTSPATYTRNWFYSPSGVAELPTWAGLWDAQSHAIVAQNAVPAWSGAAASGWVSSAFSVPLTPGKRYITSVFNSENANPWFLASASWWGGSPGPFSAGITQGKLVIVGNSAATIGQDSWNTGTVLTFPATSTNPEFDGLDLEVA